MKIIAGIAALFIMGGLAGASDHNMDANASLEALNERFNQAAANHDAADLLSLYADNTLWIEQGKPVSQGLDGPRALFEFVAANKGMVTHTIDHLFVSDDASLAVMIGSVAAKMATVGLDATGTYLFVLKPEDEGWEIITDMWHQHDEKQP